MGVSRVPKRPSQTLPISPEERREDVRGDIEGRHHLTRRIPCYAGSADCSSGLRLSKLLEEQSYKNAALTLLTMVMGVCLVLSDRVLLLTRSWVLFHLVLHRCSGQEAKVDRLVCSWRANAI